MDGSLNHVGMGMIRRRCIAGVMLSVLLAGSTSAGERQKGMPWSVDGAVLELDHVVHRIDKLYLRSCTYFFDGGSLCFGFATSPTGPCEVFVTLPLEGYGLVDEKQKVVVSSHSHFGRYAISHADDESHDAFVKLIAKAKAGTVRDRDSTDQEALAPAIELVRAAVIDGKIPEKWGSEAFPEMLGEEKEAAEDSAIESDDHPFDDF